MSAPAPASEVERLLKKHGAVLLRHRKHLIWKFPSGRLLVQSSTPSDVNAEFNQLREIRRIIGVDNARGAAGERRERSNRPGRAADGTKIHHSANTAMLDALRKVALTEDALNAKIATLTIELRSTRRANRRKRVQLHRLHAHCKACWGCAIKRAWNRFWEWRMQIAEVEN